MARITVRPVEFDLSKGSAVVADRLEKFLNVPNPHGKRRLMQVLPCGDKPFVLAIFEDDPSPVPTRQPEPPRWQP